MRVLLLVIVLVCIVLFVAGVFAPERSKRMQTWVAQKLHMGERHADEKAGKVGDLTNSMLEKSRSATNASARGGRKVNEKAGDAASAVREKL